MPKKNDSDYVTRQGHRERMKKHIIDGKLSSLSDIQLLEMLLFFAITQKDTQPIARTLIDVFKGFGNVFDMSITELKQVDGVGENMACLIKLIPEILKRYRVSKLDTKMCFNRRSYVSEYLKPFLELNQREELHMICLDSSLRLIKHIRVEEGDQNTVNIYVRKLCEYAISTGATNVLIAHNHPSGVARPSFNDNLVTKELYGIFRILGVNIIDHIIVAKEDSYSYNDDGKFTEYEKEYKDKAVKRSIADEATEFIYD